METSHFRITFAEPFNETDLFALERYLKDAGYFIELERLPPSDEEMGGKAVALILIAGITFEQLQESSHIWEIQHSKPHIELIEPLPPRKEKEKVENKPNNEQFIL